MFEYSSKRIPFKILEDFFRRQLNSENLNKFEVQFTLTLRVSIAVSIARILISYVGKNRDIRMLDKKNLENSKTSQTIHQRGIGDFRSIAYIVAKISRLNASNHPIKLNVKNRVSLVEVLDSVKYYSKSK